MMTESSPEKQTSIRQQEIADELALMNKQTAKLEAKNEKSSIETKKTAAQEKKQFVKIVAIGDSGVGKTSLI